MSLSSALWTSRSRLILASKSASRRQMLASAGLVFDVEAAEIDERQLEADFLACGGAPEDLALALARAKALEVSDRNRGALCLGADQTLSLEGRLIHKSTTSEEATRTLAALAGRRHRLTAAFALARDGHVIGEGVDSAVLAMRALDARSIALYLASAGPDVLASVGVYQVEGLGVHLFESIEGDHTTILGLPMLKLLACLRREGALAL